MQDLYHHPTTTDHSNRAAMKTANCYHDITVAIMPSSRLHLTEQREVTQTCYLHVEALQAGPSGVHHFLSFVFTVVVTPSLATRVVVGSNNAK